MSMSQQVRSDFFKLSLHKNTWSANGLMANTKFTSLKNFNNVDVSIYNYEVS